MDILSTYGTTQEAKMQM